VTAARAARDSPARGGADSKGTPGGGEVPAPEPLPADALDSHCHLDLIDQPANVVVAAAQAAGIRRMITVGVDLASSRWSAECAAAREDVYAAVAIHPNETASAASSSAGRDAVLAQIAELAAQPQVRAIGETGLDYYRDHASPEVQRDWFRAHIAIAKQSGKALMIHDRDAHEDVLRILEEEGPPEEVVFHCFSGDAAMAKRCAEAGYVMSFAGNLTFKNAQPLRDAAAVAPAEAILVETDAPFLTPVPQRGKPNSPAMAAHTLRCLAAVKQIDIAQLCALVTATGERVFGPW
jgi:TatD DNase family protein